MERGSLDDETESKGCKQSSSDPLPVPGFHVTNEPFNSLAFSSPRYSGSEAMTVGKGVQQPFFSVKPVCREPDRGTEYESTVKESDDKKNKTYINAIQTVVRSYYTASILEPAWLRPM